MNNSRPPAGTVICGQVEWTDRSPAREHRPLRSRSIQRESRAACCRRRRRTPATAVPGSRQMQGSKPRRTLLAQMTLVRQPFVVGNLRQRLQKARAGAQHRRIQVSLHALIDAAGRIEWVVTRIPRVGCRKRGQTHVLLARWHQVGNQEVCDLRLAEVVAQIEMLVFLWFSGFCNWNPTPSIVVGIDRILAVVLKARVQIAGKARAAKARVLEIRRNSLHQSVLPALQG